MNPALLVGLGGVLGALSRFAVGSLVGSLVGGRRRDTLAVNVLGSFALGALTTGLAADATLLTVFGTGFCGAFTTFSSFAVETVELYETGARRAAVVNAATNLVGALLAVGLGGWLATAL
ncbi:CrcB family protein [Halorussus gelatinilyticus]|uniref:Fluoride-specific ion channel FluC n=1 Tax=Halorussus gelatinilyticus TaxID=2937524 RepID=A0A8U0IM84_9EURY|nr:CrcB family protein [Halorussus gelatinilyticus]UPW02273.1 CrcB family protein [Halorussus gelatinilyticus]